jgi:hypothetical protein
MFHEIQRYGLIDAGGVWYRPRAYGHPQPNGMWDGWLVFFPADGASPIAPPAPETTQSNMASLTDWAEVLSEVYLEGALDRAIALEEQPTLIAELSRTEDDLLEDANRRS